MLFVAKPAQKCNHAGLYYAAYENQNIPNPGFQNNPNKASNILMTLLKYTVYTIYK